MAVKEDAETIVFVDELETRREFLDLLTMVQEAEEEQQEEENCF